MHPARERFGADGKARATRRPAAVCKERATPPDAPKRSRPPGCSAFWPGLRCSSVTDRCGYAPSSRLGQAKNRSNARCMGISTDSYERSKANQVPSRAPRQLFRRCRSPVADIIGCIALAILACGEEIITFRVMLSRLLVDVGLLPRIHRQLIEVDPPVARLGIGLGLGDERLQPLLSGGKEPVLRLVDGQLRSDGADIG